MLETDQRFVERNVVTKQGMLGIKCHDSSCKWTASRGKCSGFPSDDICVTVASFAILWGLFFFFKSCILSSHFRWSHRYAKRERERENEGQEKQQSKGITWHSIQKCLHLMPVWWPVLREGLFLTTCFPEV